MTPLRALLFLALLATSACTPRATDTVTREGTDYPTTPAPINPAEQAYHETADVAGLGPRIPNDFGAAMYAPSRETSAEQILSSIRRANPGKALYLDLWATWCMPCIGEFPDSRSLHNEVAGLPVEFVYLCTSLKGTQARWESIVKNNELPGVHVFVDQATHNQIMNSFRTNAFPTYVVITADGDSKRDVARPSSLNRGKMERLLK